MEDDRLDYNTRKFMSEGGLDHTDTILYAKSKKEVEGEGKHLYDPHSAVEYLRFYHNCTSHFDSKKEPGVVPSPEILFPFSSIGLAFIRATEIWHAGSSDFLVMAYWPRVKKCF